jgi:hypothetical protein
MHKTLTPIRTRGIGMLVAVAALCGMLAPLSCAPTP